MNRLSMKCGTVLWLLAAVLTCISLVCSGTVSGCPEGCLCPHALRVNCSYSTLRHLPSGLGASIRVLDLVGNAFVRLENYTFANVDLPNLRVLHLQDNRIISAHKHTFTQLASLRFVYLDGNQISGLPLRLFSDNPRLEGLGLSRNPLRFPNRGPFLHSPSLEVLDLSHCNLSWLSEESFVLLTSLKELRLSFNFLKNLSPDLFQPLDMLQYLYLSHNSLSHINQDLFIYLVSLKLLDISYNGLQELESPVFRNQSNLQVLYLQFNNLSILPEDLFYSLGELSELYLQNNSIQAIESSLFGSMPSLRMLYLDNNAIVNVSRDAFSSLESLTHLYISNNWLHSFSARLVCMLPRLRFLRIFGNPLPCDCQLKGLWEWAPPHGAQVWGSCVPEGSSEVLSNSSLPLVLAPLACNQTSCIPEVLPEPEDTFLLLVYILSGVCPLVLVIVCSVITVCAFKNHHRNSEHDRDPSYNLTSSSTGYLMQEPLALTGSQMYSSDDQQTVDNGDYTRQATPLKECSHVSPYSVSPVLYERDDSTSSHGPPPIPAKPPKELLCASPYALPVGYVREAVPTRARAFSTSEEEESRPLMRHHLHHAHSTMPAVPSVSHSSSFRARQARRLRPRHQLGNLSSDTEPWSSYSEDASDTVSVTQCEMATWSGSEASTQIVSENNVDTAHA